MELMAVDCIGMQFGRGNYQKLLGEYLLATSTMATSLSPSVGYTP